MVLQLRMKQNYVESMGVTERQLENYYANSAQKGGITGEILIQTPRISFGQYCSPSRIRLF